MASWYKHREDGMPRTGEYKFSVASLKDGDLQELRRSIRKHNQEIRKQVRKNKWGRGEYIAEQLLRVRIMPRGPRAEHAEGMFNNWGSQLSRRGYDSYLPQQFAEYFDVYVGKDTTAVLAMKHELETGQTPGEQKRIAKLQNEIWSIEIKARARMVY